jgi:membrane protein implicated in regulation of membrane protease activity
MEPRSLGLLIATIGIVLVVLGLLVATGALSWFGRLPGDIRIESGNTRVYIPITTMLLLSVGLSLLAAIFRRFQ